MKYIDTIPPFKMEIKIVYTEGNACKDTKNHELQKNNSTFSTMEQNHFRIFLSLVLNCENKLLKVYFVPNL